MVGDGRVDDLDLSGASDTLAFGQAACHLLERAGGKLARRPPGLLPPVRALTCRRERGVFGPRNTHFPVDAVSADVAVLEVPHNWGVEAVESDGQAAIIVAAHTVLCLFEPRGSSLLAILDRVTRLWGTHRTDPAERALNRAISTAIDQVPRGANVVLGYSGGLTSVVSAHVLRRAIGERVMGCFVWTGLEQTPIRAGISKSGVDVVVVDAREQTMRALHGLTDIRDRRVVLARVFSAACADASPGAMLSQGATYDSLLWGTGQPAAAAGSSGLVQPLETLFRAEVELVVKALELPLTLTRTTPSGYADNINGPFCREAVDLCRVVDATLMRQLSDARTPVPGVRVRHTFVVDVWEREPRVCFGYEDSEDGAGWRRMRLREGAFDVVVAALRAYSGMANLRVWYDVSRAGVGGN